MNVLIKISGDLLTHGRAADFILAKARNKDCPRVAVICGGRTQINQRFEAYGIKSVIANGIRVHESETSRWEARHVLIGNRTRLAGMLGYHPNVDILVPSQVIRNHACHFDADDYLRLLAPNFDESYCLTLEGRIKNFPSGIEVVYFKKGE